MNLKLYAIVPLLNEAKNTPQLFSSLISLRDAVAGEFDLFVIFVDDGSRDNTARCLEEGGGGLACKVLRHDVNRGPGAAFATGFAWLSDQLKPEDWVVTMEGDGTSKQDIIARLLARRREGYDTVLASPYAYGGGFSQVSIVRMLISHTANSLVKIVMGIKGIHTFSCFLRLYQGATIRKLQEAYGPAILRMQGFECMVEMLGKLILMKARISEVEMTVDWSLRQGRSNMKIAKTTMGYLKLFARWKSLSGPNHR